MNTEAIQWAWDQELKPNCQLVLVYLATKADTKNCAEVALHRIEAATGLSYRSVIRALQQLTESGVIVTLKGGAKAAKASRNAYVLSVLCDNLGDNLGDRLGDRLGDNLCDTQSHNLSHSPPRSSNTTTTPPRSVSSEPSRPQKKKPAKPRQQKPTTDQVIQAIPLPAPLAQLSRFPAAWREWVDYRLDLPAPKGKWSKLFKAQLHKAAELEDPVEALELAMANGWQGFIFDTTRRKATTSTGAFDLDKIRKEMEP